MERRGWRDEQGSVAPILLIVLTIMLAMGWALAGTVATHYVQAARRSRDIAAEQLARAGIEAAVSLIDAGTVSPGTYRVDEGSGYYEVTITDTGQETYVVMSTGVVGDRSRTIQAEVAPPPEPFVLLSGGDIRVSYTNAVTAGGSLTLEGDVNAHGDVELKSTNALLSIGTLRVKGDVRAGGDANLTALTPVAAMARTIVDGGLSTNGDVTLEANAGLLGTARVEVNGPLVRGGELSTQEIGLGFASINLNGPDIEGGGVTPPEYAVPETVYFEAMVELMDQLGQLEHMKPPSFCVSLKITQPTRLTGDLRCTNLTIQEGAMLVVDGSLDVVTATVEGLLYVRGGPSADPTGDVEIGTLVLLELIRAFYPASGGGAVVATGNISIGTGSLAALLAFGKNYGTVLQVVALSTGPGDTRNDIEYGLGGLANIGTGSKSAPLLLYAGGNGDILIRDGTLIDAISFDELPLIAVAGGDLKIEVGDAISLINSLTLKAEPKIWDQVPPFLQELGRARVLTWEWKEL